MIKLACNSGADSCVGYSNTIQNFFKTGRIAVGDHAFSVVCFSAMPNANANPYADCGNSIVSAFDALLFCGTAFVLFQVEKTNKG